MKAIINFTEDSPYYQHGEKQRIVEDLIEVHYSYPSPFSERQTAFEGKETGFTVYNKYIKDFEIKI